MNRISVIGIGYKPLTRQAAEKILAADTVAANGSLIEVFRRYAEYDAASAKIKIINNVDETMEYVKRAFEAGRKTVLLASGDPLFNGIGRRALHEFGRGAVEIYPEISSVQAAFAAIREPWDDAFLMSLHGGPNKAKRRALPYAASDVPRLLARYAKLAILTDGVNTPQVIAATLVSNSTVPQCTVYVCQRLGREDEKITHGGAREIAETATFDSPNVVIVMLEKTKESISRADAQTRTTELSLSLSAPPRLSVNPFSSLSSLLPPAFGLTEGQFSHARGLITKDEVRAVSIHRLGLSSEGVLWDIGAGCGSVSIEAARMFPLLGVFAVEADEEQVNLIHENRRTFCADNVQVIAGRAPEALENLPAPTNVFIGGSGGLMEDIIGRVAMVMPQGTIVVNAATLETLNAATAALARYEFTVEVSQVSAVRIKNLGGMSHFGALNPVFVISGRRA
jgi:precorrin-6Y C5,15-methyltransferase (decarboxylating)